MTHSQQTETPPSKALAYTFLTIGIVLSLLVVLTIPFAVAFYLMSLLQVPCLILLPFGILLITASGTIGGSILLLRGSWNGIFLFGIGILPFLLFLIGAGGAVTELCPLHV